jgi:protein-L-isoaspartate(D-aspartate) O-methyltransferase
MSVIWWDITAIIKVEDGVIPDWAAERRYMVETQLRRRGIHDPRVLAAMGEIPREEFVPLEARVLAYRDEPTPIGLGQTISQPYMTGLMAQELALKGHEKVLEIGGGCGYAAAVLGCLAARVITVEILPPLAKLARTNLHRLGRGHNVEVVDGDGGLGYPAAAPFDGITVAAAAPEIPLALLEQLGDPGVLVIPVGGLEDQELRVIAKRGGHIKSRVSTLCRFVPLRGGEGWR